MTPARSSPLRLRLRLVAFLAAATCAPLQGCGCEGNDAPITMPTPTSLDFACDATAWGGEGRTVYYVAINEPGASNEACDGLAPTDEGGGHCPFRDFSSADVRRKLYLGPDLTVGAKSTTMLVREGTYPIVPLAAFENEPNIPLWIYSAGASEAEAVVLAAYPGETVVLDGSCDPSLLECSSPEDPGRIWTLLNLWGSWIRVEGLTFDDAHKWNITVQASQTCVRENLFLGPYGSDSDSIKSFNGSGPAVVFRENEFTGHMEQAMDLTNAYDWVIEDNVIHDGVAGIGGKFGMHDMVIRGNHFYDIERTALGTGTSSDHDWDYEAWNIVFEGNLIENVGEHAFQIVYCERCIVRDNDVDGARFGVFIPDQGPSGCPGGCAGSAGTEITGNRFRNMLGGDDAPPDLFVAADPAVAGDITAGDNLYCFSAGAEAAFWHGGKTVMTFDEWRLATGADETSSVLPANDPACTGSW